MFRMCGCKSNRAHTNEIDHNLCRQSRDKLYQVFLFLIFFWGHREEGLGTRLVKWLLEPIEPRPTVKCGLDSRHRYYTRNRIGNQPQDWKLYTEQDWKPATGLETGHAHPKNCKNCVQPVFGRGGGGGNNVTIEGKQESLCNYSTNTSSF